MKKFLTAAVALIQMFLICACSTANTESSDKLQVYTSFYAMYDFAKQIGGDKADVYLLCPAEQEPHEFEPTAQDIAAISKADVFIYNGMGMEHWTDSLTNALSGDVTALCTTDYVKTDNTDPHVWLNPDNAYAQISAIADVFKEKDADNADFYDKNLKECKQKIDVLKQDLKAAAGTFNSHSIVVSHDAYSHLCDILDITSVTVNGTDNHDEVSPTKMAKTEDYIKTNGIKYIFTEPLGTSDIMETIAKDTGCEILVLNPFEGNSDNKDYFSVMNENIAALTQALN